MNAAFMLQQMDLWFSKNEIGSCWLGMPNAVSEAASLDGLPFTIMLAFGTPNETIHRESVSEFKRRPLAEITNTSDINLLLEPLRLAPSASNRQPWLAAHSDNKVHIFAKDNNFITKKIYGIMATIDMGIALCHLWLAAMKNERFKGFKKLDSLPTSYLSGYSYVVSISVVD